MERSGIRFSRKVSQIDDGVFRLVLGLPHDALPLIVGEPDFPPPPFVNDAAVEAIVGGKTHYTPAPGLMPLREAIARKLRTENGLAYEPSEIVVTPGASAAVSLLFLSLLDRGDEVLIPDPLWFHYSTLAELAGGTPIRVPLDSKDGLRLWGSAIEKAATSRTKILVINSPSNPTGRVLSDEELEDAAGVAERLGLTVVSDEIYEKIVYRPNRHRSIATLSGMRDRAVVINGFSKGYAMTGWRVGYAAAPREIIDRLSSILGYTLLCAGSVAQHAAIEALKNPKSEEYTKMMVQTWERRRAVVMKYVEENHPIISAMQPQGTFYCWLDVSRTGMDGREAARRILREGNVGVLPGYVFGDQGRGFVRISFATSDSAVREGMERLCHVLNRRPIK